jgi:RNA polymerase sigma-70 factor (ECF subfamily)
MLKAFKAFGRLHEESFMRAWLMCIMRNTWITKCRAESRRRESLVADVSEEALGFAFRNPAGDVLSAECQALFHVMNAEMVAALSALSPVLRKTLYYVAIEGMTGVQAADVMGIPEGTVASRMHRIRRHLRRSAIVTGQQPETTRTFRRAARSPQTVTEQAATG